MIVCSPSACLDLVDLAVVLEPAVERDQPVAPPDLAIARLALEDRHEQDLDLARDPRLDDKLVARAGEGDDVAPHLAIDFVMNRVLVG